MKKEIVFIIRESNIVDRVRFFKFVNYFSTNYRVQLWKKKGSKDFELEHKYVNITKSYNNKLVEYTTWLLKLFIKLLFSKSDNRVFIATGFESVLPVYLISFFQNKKYIFDNADNFYLSKSFSPSTKKKILQLEESIINQSIFTIIPDISRSKGYNVLENKFVILKNFPSKRDYNLSLQSIQNSKDKKFTIYMNGWLVETRGLKMIEEFIDKLKQNLDLKIKIAGKIDNLEKILNNKHVIYLGELDPISSLREYHNSDLIITFYDPAVEINRVATPNKWGDCLMSNTVPIINKEIQTKNDYFPKGGYFEVEYNNSDDLLKIVMEIYNNPNILKRKKEELNKNPKYFWETQLNEILNSYNV